MVVNISILRAQPTNDSSLVSVDTDSDLVTLLKSDENDPFDKEAKIHFRLANTAKVRILITTPLGHTIRELVSNELTPGIHTFVWDGKDDDGNPTKSGVFLYKVETEKIVRSDMLALLN